jgi:hypothetical protein
LDFLIRGVQLTSQNATYGKTEICMIRHLKGDEEWALQSTRENPQATGMCGLVVNANAQVGKLARTAGPQ